MAGQECTFFTNLPSDSDAYCSWRTSAPQHRVVRSIWGGYFFSVCTVYRCTPEGRQQACPTRTTHQNDWAGVKTTRLDPPREMLNSVMCVSLMFLQLILMCIPGWNHWINGFTLRPEVEGLYSIHSYRWEQEAVFILGIKRVGKRVAP